MPMKIKAVSFDMDGTLIRNTDSVRYLCTLNNNVTELERIERLESDGTISWIEADYLKAKLIRGLDIEAVNDNFDQGIQLIQNIDKVLSFLKERRIVSVLITSGPIQVAGILGEKFGFDAIYGSDYEVENGRFTGRIKTHLDHDGKLQSLTDYCISTGISLEHCIAIGDSESDLAVFEKCGKSIAINYSDTLKGKATEYVYTEDLYDLINILISWLAE
jgi:phosphoserine phosphatase